MNSMAHRHMDAIFITSMYVAACGIQEGRAHRQAPDQSPTPPQHRTTRRVSTACAQATTVQQCAARGTHLQPRRVRGEVGQWRQLGLVGALPWARVRHGREQKQSDARAGDDKRQVSDAAEEPGVSCDTSAGVPRGRDDEFRMSVASVALHGGDDIRRAQLTQRSWRPSLPRSQGWDTPTGCLPRYRSGCLQTGTAQTTSTGRLVLVTRAGQEGKAPGRRPQANATAQARWVALACAQACTCP